MGEFNKEILSNYADFHCERRLFWDLGSKDDNWIKPMRNKIALKHFRSGTKLLTLGHEYEKKIYGILKKQPQMNLLNKPNVKIVKKDFLDWKEFFTNDKDQALLIEPQFIVPENYLLDFFAVKNINQINIKDITSSCRPDIIVLKRNINNDANIRALRHDGTSIQLSQQEKQSKIGIYIYDVKLTHPDLIKPRHLIQILFYMHTIAHLLKYYELEKYYYVSVSNNGIIGNYTDFLPISLDELMNNYVTQVDWDNSSHFYRETQKVILNLMKKIPCSLNQSRVNIQAACGRCNYLDDCKTTLGFYDNDPSKISLELLPYISQSLAYQMKSKNWKNIEDVYNNIQSVANSTIPNALYPQIPHLKIISEALLKNDKIKPKPDSIKSIKIPGYTELSLVFSVEEDSAYKRLFAFSLDFEVRMYNTQYKELFEKWWHFWNDILQLSKDEFDNRKDESLERFKNDINENISINKLLAIKNLFNSIINQQDGMISLDNKKSVFQCNFSYLSDNIDEKAELSLAKSLINHIFDIIVLCSYIDEYIQVTITNDDDKEYVKAPSFAMFYWSQEILQAIEDMLGRQLVNLMDEIDYEKKVSKLISWITPSESHLKDPMQHKKIYDLRAYVESTHGFPLVINYTWHEILNKLFDWKYSFRYWSPHFNYLNFEAWYDFIEEKDTNKKINLQNEINEQLKKKVRHINILRRNFQSFGKESISKQVYLPRTGQIGNIAAHLTHYHRLGKLFAIFSKLTGAYEDLENLEYRTTFPEFSIGKLQAAEVSYLRKENVRRGARGAEYFVYYFELQGLSSNIKISENSEVLLVPEPLRDNWLATKFPITIDTMEWRSATESYFIQTKEVGKDYVIKYEDYADKNDLDMDPKWYLYPTGRDVWSGKLFEKEESLLNRFNIGSSWLGFLIANKWQLAKNLPEKTDDYYSLAEIYLYAPNLINEYLVPLRNDLRNSLFNINSLEDQLLTNINPHPDNSQKKAIYDCFENYFSAIIGPPGTGKSQTIATLIDEFIKRKKKNNPEEPVRILVSGFSYKSIDVLIEKINAAKNADGSQATVSKFQRIRLRSASKDPNPLAEDLCYTGTWKLNGESGLYRGAAKKIEDNFEKDFIIFGNAHQLYNLAKLGKPRFKFLHSYFSFDLIVIDEASQLPVDHFMASLLFFPELQIKVQWKDKHEQTLKIEQTTNLMDDLKNFKLPRVIIVGDHNQLPPVQPIPPPKDLQPILSSLFSYYVEHHKVPFQQLETNYRSNKDIVNFTSTLGFYQNLKAHSSVADRTLQINRANINFDWLKDILDPERIVLAIVHENQFDTAISEFEANIVVETISNYYQQINPTSIKEESNFWQKEIGVVAPHNAHGRMIIRKLIAKISLIGTQLDITTLNSYIKKAIVSVEKFQGSDRNFIIASVGISSIDQLKAEEEFIYDLTRFNVLTSRAKAKVILVCSYNYLNYLPQNQDFLENSFKIRNYALKYCNKKKKYSDVEIVNKKENFDLYWFEN